MRMLVAMVVFVRVLVPALFLLLVPLTTTWAAGGLSVTTPNGGQKWTIGKKYAIKWRKGTAGTSVRISLTKSGRHYKWISKKTRNDGRYTWKIPTSVAAGSAYKIKIKSVKKKKILDSSNRYFTIKKKKTRGGGKSSITVTVPNGGQKWKANKTYALKWSKSNAGSYVKIQLLTSGRHHMWISNKTKNDGKYTWKIPATLKTSNAYTIKIVSTTKRGISDTSDTKFKITTSAGRTGEFRSMIVGRRAFHGWEGEEIYKLLNGQYWMQTGGYCNGDYGDHPEVLVYHQSGWKMEVKSEGRCNSNSPGYIGPVPVKKLKRVISSQIDGMFEGWVGNNQVVTLQNGETWQQTETSYQWLRRYEPDVLVFFDGTWKMKVYKDYALTHRMLDAVRVKKL
tara:strand:+ start:1047 stop:2228 length:1182 start_codon:yes stop_codon:yes gene_type:complete